MSHKKPVVDIFCREVGCKGTDVSLTPTEDGILCEFSDYSAEGTDKISWEDLVALVKWGIDNGHVELC